MAGEYRIVRDAEHGYRHLDPLPAEDEVVRFYESKYYDLIRSRERAPDLRRLLSGGPEADEERAWLRATLYEDIATILQEEHRGFPGRLLDIGCGTGEFLAYMGARGWSAEGLELAEEAALLGRQSGLDVHCLSVREMAEEGGAFDAISVLHVLEHAPDPESFLGDAARLLAPAGTLVIQVPNDFSELQLAAQARVGKPTWWVAVPDHLHYFDFPSLRSLLRAVGLESVRTQATFPMELFLLMGDDYVGDPETGAECHARRRRFESALPGELRRRLYSALASVGIGRDCLVFAKKRGSPQRP